MRLNKLAREAGYRCAAVMKVGNGWVVYFTTHRNNSRILVMEKFFYSRFRFIAIIKAKLWVERKIKGEGKLNA